jgi:GT2 family glycosyltransferase/glycosyltransferase involved in cell wall biosynthesis
MSALDAHPPGGEIIVVDNGSSDATSKHLAKEYPEVRVIRLPRNQGFAKAANRGVLESQYPTVILLNNDMVVDQDFVFPLLQAFDNESATFGVSSQIYFLDEKKPRWETGKVHARWEFGTITLFHLYRWDEELLYPVFYAGGGASAYDRDKFLSLGGFDDKVFEPVYIEDGDLGYRAWKRGWPSLFAPKSVVHHKHRSTTSLLWSEGAIYSFFVKNLAALVWKNIRDIRFLVRHLFGLIILPARVYKNAGNKSAVMTYWGLVCQIPRVIRARIRESLIPRTLEDQTIMEVSRYRYAFRAHFGCRSPRIQKRRKQMLMVSPFSPYPPLHGGAVRMYSLLKRLRHNFEIDLISYADTPAEFDSESIEELRKMCRRVILIDRDVSSVGGILEPSHTRGFRSEEMAQEIEYFLDREDYDVVQVEYTRMSHFMPSRTANMVRVLVEHDVSFVSLGRSRATLHGFTAQVGLWFDWMRMLRYEIKAVENADLVAVMSETDKAVLGKFVDTSSIFSIPNGVDCEQFQFTTDGRESGSILFVGFFRHEPNVKAVNYFYRDVLPIVRNNHPEAHFRIVGAYPPETIRQLGKDARIEVTGRVEDIGHYYRQSAVFVVPLLQGSGTRLKILEAMASGCPIVSTTIGAEGLGTVNGEHILIADTSKEMAEAIHTLLSDPEFGSHMAKRAREYVRTHYDWSVIASRLLKMYDRGST